MKTKLLDEEFWVFGSDLENTLKQGKDIFEKIMSSHLFILTFKYSEKV